MARCRENLRDKRIVSLDLTGMLAGTKYRGDFEDRLKNVLKEVGKAKDVVLFIDELHTVIGAGRGGGRDRRGEYPQARPLPRRDPDRRRDDALGIPQTH